MKRLVFVWMSFVLLVLLLPMAAFAGKGVTILGTGSIKGFIEPCFV